MDFVNNHSAHPGQKGFEVGIAAAQHHIQRFRGGEHDVRPLGAPLFDVTGSDGQDQIQPLGDDGLKPSHEIFGQGPGWNKCIRHHGPGPM